MKVLWFTNTPSNYLTGAEYNGGGWISSLELELKKRNDVELGIAFLLNGHPKKVESDNVCYYPISNPYKGSIMGKIRRLIVGDKSQRDYFASEYLRVINDFNPNIINIFGTEQDFGLMAQYTQIPIVIHIQGLMGPCFMSYFPPGFSFRDYILNCLNPFVVYKRYRNFISYRDGAKREREILMCNSHFMGRTEWDKKVTSIYCPEATYDYCGEILREEFYRPFDRNIPQNLTITSTISSSLYKGFDVILKCAKLMKDEMNMNFEWRVFGNIQPRYVERKVGVVAKSVNVRLLGVASQEVLRKSILESTLYVHPSYIDNSSNSVCEAQMLGCPVVGQYVGGMSSLVTDNNGKLVPANDPYQMVLAIREIYNNPTLNKSMGRNALDSAQRRHNKQQIVNDLISIYHKYEMQ